MEKKSIDYRVAMALDYINRDQRQFSVADLARKVGLSPSGFRLLFKAELGVSPHTYIKQYKLEAARVLLCTKPLSVKEVMAHVGFQDASHFVRDFQLSFGLSPLQYSRKFFGTVLSATRAPRLDRGPEGG
jgi:AraC-like DNA-binding protein